MTKRISERQRWVQVSWIPQPAAESADKCWSRDQHMKARAVIDAFDAIGRVVRAEPSEHGPGIILKARKA